MLPGYFNIRSLSQAIFIQTWLNFASFRLQKPTKIASWRRVEASWARLGGLLGRLGRVLERLGLILERLGGVLERLGRVSTRLGRVLTSIMLSAIWLGPGTQLRLAAGHQQ